MIFNVGDFEILVPAWLMVMSGFIVAFIITYLAVPVIVRIARDKNFFADLNGRSSHKEPTPNLGGVAVFAGVVLASVLFSSLASSHELKYIIAGMLVLFFLGLKDDFIPLVPYKKILGQLAAAFIVIVPGDIRITCFHDLFGIGDVGYVLSLAVTFLLFLALVNSFNLIDGIDGLASGIGILCSVVFGTWFILAGHTSYAVFSSALIGSLLAFFGFNVWGRKNKIFLGDTGSMITGFLVAVFVVRFLEFENVTDGWLSVSATPAVAFSIVIVPLFDTGRVILSRIWRGKSPFEPDKTHIHHRLLEIVRTHLHSTIIILIVNLIFIFLGISLQFLPNELLLIILLLCAGLVSAIPVIIVKNN